MTVGDGRPPALPLNVPCSCGREGQGRRPAARPLTASSQGKCAQIWPAGAADDSNQGMDWCLTGAALSNMAHAVGPGRRTPRCGEIPHALTLQPSPNFGDAAPALLTSLTTRHPAIGQLFMVDFSGSAPSAGVERLIVDAGVAGVILFVKNITSPAQIAGLT